MLVGVIGLGNMGLGMAINLLPKVDVVLGYDVSPTAQQKAKDKGISLCHSLAELVERVDIIVLSLPKAEHVLEVCLGNAGIGVLAKKPLTIIDTSTSTPEVSRRIHQELLTKKIVFIDAPVSGGPIGAISGTMSMVVGASEEHYQKVLPLLQKMSAKQVRVGNIGAGNIVKIGNNLLIAAHLITTAEVVSLANKAGVSPQDFLNGLNQGSGRSAASEVNFDKWILNHAYDSGFTMGLMRKDVGLAKELMQDLNLDFPLVKEVMNIWSDSTHVLSDNEDFNAIVKLTDKTLF